MMATPFIYPLDKLDSSHIAVAGGKGASLGELMRAGTPVPGGFVVASDAFRAFMDASDHRQIVEQVIEKLDAGALRVAEAAQTIKTHLAAVPVPGEVAAAIDEAARALGPGRVSVRSSATCEDSGASAWAGQLDTYLDVPPERIIEKVRDCWLSLFGRSALAYGAAHGYGGAQIAVAVVVQQMVASEVAGIGFSVHPVTQEPNIMLIEACLGLGEAIVSGRVVPDQYVVERSTEKILERAVGSQVEGLFVEPGDAGAQWRKLAERGKTQKLSDEQVRQYAQLLGGIQDHYRHPVDTEWALEEGRFWVLQARPITTLADEYAEPIIDAADDWRVLARRPMTLVEVSIWSHWLDSQHAAASMGVIADRALSIQDDAGMANDFLTASAIDAGIDHVVDMYRDDRRRVVEALQRGRAIYRDAGTRIKRGAAGFRDLGEVVDFFALVAQYTTVFPAWVLIAYEREGLDDEEIRTLADELRAHTLYPSIERQIVDPLVADAAQALGFRFPDQAPQVVTLKELRAGTLNHDLLESRLDAVRAGRRFVFQSLDGDDRVRFVSQTGYLLMRLAKQRQIVEKDDPNQLSGQPAWPGVHRGRARVVLAADTMGQSIEEGEVLVSIQCSPELMPLVVHAGAIVTDDGGIACHAAIIARELRKPTLIGTGRATSVIHTGDLVEVDTFAGVVRILERGGS